MEHYQQSTYDATEFNSAQKSKNLQLLVARLLYHRAQVIVFRALVADGMSKEDAECKFLADIDLYDKRVEYTWNCPAEDKMRAEMDAGFKI